MCEEYSQAKRNYGEDMAARIHQRIAEIKSSDSVEMMIKFNIGRCHLLKGDKSGFFAVDLIHPYRLIFSKVKEIIECVEIQKIEDYH